MQVYIVDSNDGDTQVFSTWEKAWAYAQGYGWASYTKDAELDSGPNNSWTLTNANGEKGEILARVVNDPD